MVFFFTREKQEEARKEKEEKNSDRLVYDGKYAGRKDCRRGRDTAVLFRETDVKFSYRYKNRFHLI